MNATEKADILEETGKYHYESHPEFRTTRSRWYFGAIMIAAGESYAKVTGMAYQHYLEKQEALEVQRAQAADDAAGEAEYSEVMQEVSEVMADEIYAVECFPSDAIKLLQQEIAKNRAELEALKAENARLEAENESLKISVAELEAVVLNGAILKQAPTAQAASEVTLSDAEIDFLINNTGDTSEDYEDYTAPSYLIPDALYKKLEKLTDFTIFSNHYRLAREYDTAANRAAISARRKTLGLGE